jgi:hypothetical protein
VKSVFRLDTPFTVEEQFTNIEVNLPVSIIKVPLGGSTPTQAKCLVLEMMGVRDNYKSATIVEDDLCVDLAGLAL